MRDFEIKILFLIHSVPLGPLRSTAGFSLSSDFCVFDLTASRVACEAWIHNILDHAKHVQTNGVHMEVGSMNMNSVWHWMH